MLTTYTPENTDGALSNGEDLLVSLLDGRNQAHELVDQIASHLI